MSEGSFLACSHFGWCPGSTGSFQSALEFPVQPWSTSLNSFYTLFIVSSDAAQWLDNCLCIQCSFRTERKKNTYCQLGDTLSWVWSIFLGKQELKKRSKIATQISMIPPAHEMDSHQSFIKFAHWKDKEHLISSWGLHLSWDRASQSLLGIRGDKNAHHHRGPFFKLTVWNAAGVISLCFFLRFSGAIFARLSRSVRVGPTSEISCEWRRVTFPSWRTRCSSIPIEIAHEWIYRRIHRYDGT